MDLPYSTENYKSLVSAEGRMQTCPSPPYLTMANNLFCIFKVSCILAHITSVNTSCQYIALNVHQAYLKQINCKHLYTKYSGSNLNLLSLLHAQIFAFLLSALQIYTNFFLIVTSHKRYLLLIFLFVGNVSVSVCAYIYR